MEHETEATKSIYEQFFQDADVDQNGYLTLDEMTAMLRKHGYKGTDKKIRDMFITVDTSGDDKISLEEYLIAMGELEPSHHKAATMREVFRKFDNNNNGSIDRSELKTSFAEMGKYFSESELTRMMEMMDTDKNGVIDYEEFIDYFTRNSSAIFSHKSRNTN